MSKLVECESCISNRAKIAELEEEVNRLKLEAKMVKDDAKMDEIKRAMISHLRSKGACLSPRNFIHAMFTLGYASWGGPINCDYQEA